MIESIRKSEKIKSIEEINVSVNLTEKSDKDYLEDLEGTYPPHGSLGYLVKNVSNSWSFKRLKKQSIQTKEREDKILQITKKYEFLIDFRQDHPKDYKYACRKAERKERLLGHLEKNVSSSWSLSQAKKKEREIKERENMILRISKTYKLLIDFRRDHPKYYRYACINESRRKKLLGHMAKSVGKKNNNMTTDEREEQILKNTKGYTLLIDFRNEYPDDCKFAERTKVRREKLLGHLEKSTSRIWDRVRILKETEKYDKYIDFQKKSRAAYTAAKKLGMLDEVKELLSVRRIRTNDELKKIAALYENRASFQNSKEHHAAYVIAESRGLIDIICSHMPSLKNNWNIFELHQVASHYKSRGEFQIMATKYYLYARKYGVLDLICGHMEKGNGVSDEDAVYIWAIRGEFFNDKQLYKVGLTSRKLGKHRIKTVSNKMNKDADLVVLADVKEGTARGLETLLKGLGENPQLTGFGGATEIRAFTHEDIELALSMIRVWDKSVA